MSIEEFGQLRQEINPDKNKLETLKENLREIFDLPKCYIFGHGTNKAQAENILKIGLESATNSLDSSAIYLDDSEETYNKILHWPHYNYKSIVIITVPHQDPGEVGGYYYDNLFDELPEDRKRDPRAGSEFRKEYYIQPQFIKGYIDVDSLSLIKNDLYNPEAKVVVKAIPDNGLRPKSPERVQKALLNKDVILSTHGDDDWE